MQVFPCGVSDFPTIVSERSLTPGHLVPQLFLVVAFGCLSYPGRFEVSMLSGCLLVFRQDQAFLAGSDGWHDRDQ